MDASIIVVNFNSEKLLHNCIYSIVNSQPKLSYEIIIVDNASSYDVAKQIDGFKKKYRHIPFTCIQNKQNLGFGKANNLGVSASKGNIILFFNTDITIVDDGVTELFNAILVHPHHAVGGKLFNSDLTPQSSCGPFFSLSVVFTMLFLKGDTRGITRYSPSEIKKVDWVSGAFFGMGKDDFIKVGGFDTNLFMYMDEVELLYRASRQNIQTIFTPYASCVHLGSASSGSRSQPIINIYQGLLYLYTKHYSYGSIQILRLLLRTKALISYIIGVVTGNGYLKQTYRKALTYV